MSHLRHHNNVLASCLAALVLGSAQAQPVISEFVASNDGVWRDEDLETVDWIELHNPGPGAVNLADWSLTDDIDLPRKWVFPATNLVSGRYLIVAASGKDRALPGRQLHTNFSLNANGEYLALISPEGEVATEFAPEYPPQYANISYGYYLGRPVYIRRPTPLQPNSTDVFGEFVADTRFNQDRGFYTEPFYVTITCATEGATIRYTTNGSKPTATTGTEYTGPLRISQTTVLRAAAFKEGLEPSNTDTQTYLFLDDVLTQAPNGAAPPDWPTSWGQNVVDYGMDPDIVNSPRWGPQLKDALTSLPSFSIVIPMGDLFDSSQGIYANPGWDGIAAERECSLELLFPDGTEGFHINCGLRIRGGFSRSTGNPKHAFRLLFRAEYGAPKLNYPLFGDEGTDTFDGIDLRTFQNYSWSFQGDNRGIFIRDQWNRDAQLAMGHQAERGRFYHLYVNGQYWGLYNTCERPEASYAETYYGGNKEDYDVVKVEAGPYTILATDGNLQAWQRLYNAARAGLSSDAAYERVQGNNPDGTPNPDYENLVDVDNLIDYMLIILYGGNLDAPISNFLSNTRPNNYYGVRHQDGLSGGFKFFVHDAEHTLLDVNQNRLGPWSAGATDLSYSNPQWIWQQMWDNPEFRIRCADHIHRYFFNAGVLTPAACRKSFDQRIAQIEQAVIAESARWGDAKRSTPLTQDDWRNTVNDIRNNYLPRRTDIVLNQLRARNLYPNVTAPSFNQHGGLIDPGFALQVSAPAGVIYLTTDGTDPRLRGGTVSPTAAAYSGIMALNETTQVKSRVLSGSTWSALNEATFTVRQTYGNLLISEIMYHPAAEGDIDGDDYEFIELKNANPFEIDLSGVHFTNGIRFTFPIGTRLGAGGFAVLARNAARFAERYPGVRLDGVYEGGLANGGERVELAHADGTPLFSVSYGDDLPWPITTDGGGFSLVPLNSDLNPDPDDAANWRASGEVGGSPGRDDAPANLPPVLVNEVLTHTDPPQLDAIELHNPASEEADIGGWYLTDNRNQPLKYRIPAGTRIAPGGFAVFDEADFNPEPGVDPSFTLSSHGEEVYLYSANAAGDLTGYSHGFSFGAAANGVSFGRHVDSTGSVTFPPQIALTLGAENAGPRIGPVVISEIQYHPAAGETEFVELKNVTAEPVPLFDPAHPGNTWRLAGIDFSFPEGLTLAPDGLLLLVGGDPDLFRTRKGVPAPVPILGPIPGNLQDNGELLELQRPDTPDVDTNGVVIVPMVTVDAVRYNDKVPWPVEAAGLGPSLERRHVSDYGNDAANWRASFGPPSPGLDNDGNRPPIVSVGAVTPLVAATFPAGVEVSGAATDDGLPEGSLLSARWVQVDGPGPVVFTTPDALTTEALFPGTGTYLLRLLASDSELESGDDVLVEITRPAEEQILVAAGSTWKYRDDGSDQGTAWRLPDFADDDWLAGAAQLGYGDGDEVTTVGYGPNGSDKYTTTYFRHTFQVVGADSATALTLQVVRDDGVLVHLNGHEVMRDNLPEGDISYTSRANTAIGGADESTFQVRDIDPTLLVEGANLLAVEIHQANPTSSDISFDLSLEALMFPTSRPPTVDAGPDRTTAAGTPIRLVGAFTDDALPPSPGVTTLSWTTVSGPAEVDFGQPSSWITDALFPVAGEYLLRLSASDGQSVVEDETRVTVAPAAAPLRILTIAVNLEGEPGASLQVSGPAGAEVVVQSRERLDEGGWEEAGRVRLGGDGAPAFLNLDLDPQEGSRFFRLLVEPSP
ncbi:MAG: lamin tail domain-containing protein [Verrucomicrobiales bacterium]|nr:lamin tail domain-containing protein [Verrucomicrobiales bacterium]